MLRRTSTGSNICCVEDGNPASGGRLGFEIPGAPADREAIHRAVEIRPIPSWGGCRIYPLDLDDCPEFNRSVYAIARKIPPGSTLTYGDIAKQLGGVELSRSVGTALGQNPCPIVVPCHRVLAAGGKPGGFSANGGVLTKLKMLAIEGAAVNYTPSLFG